MLIILLSNWNILHLTKYLRYKTSFNVKYVVIKNKAEKALSHKIPVYLVQDLSSLHLILPL